VLQFALPILFTLFLWWFATGAVIYLDGLPKRTYPLSMIAISAVTAPALYLIWLTSDAATPAAAYAAFTAALIVWCWHEMTFLLGYITGPRRAECPAECSGWKRFALASQTLIHHEIALALTAAVIAALTWNGVNQTATHAFLILWVMRLSAKLNIFLGVPNLTDEFLPPHLKFLKSYFKTAPMNLLFPASITGGTALACALVSAAAAPGADGFAQTANLLLFALTALAVLEHWFMVLPIQDAALWRWALASRRRHAERKSTELDRREIQPHPRFKSLIYEAPL
jgi:putative photosynthetic complex assembly protein 2